MKYRTLLELKPILKSGDWLIPEGKSVAMKVNLYTELPESVELYEDWCKSYPMYEWDCGSMFAYISKEDMELLTNK